jgi:hypothetical protein
MKKRRSRAWVEFTCACREIAAAVRAQALTRVVIPLLGSAETDSLQVEIMGTLAKTSRLVAIPRLRGYRVYEFLSSFRLVDDREHLQDIGLTPGEWVAAVFDESGDDLIQRTDDPPYVEAYLRGKKLSKQETFNGLWKFEAHDGRYQYWPTYRGNCSRVRWRPTKANHYLSVLKAA